MNEENPIIGNTYAHPNLSQQPPRRNKLLMTFSIIMILMVIVGIGYAISLYHTDNIISSQRQKSAQITQTKLATGGIDAGLVMNTPFSQVQLTYSGQTPGGNMQTAGSFSTTETLAAVRTYYLDYFKNNQYGLAMGLISNFIAPTNLTAPIALSASNGSQNILIYAAIDGSNSKLVDVKVTSFTNAHVGTTTVESFKIIKK